ncbi:DNA/RNA helicase domain-containing protein [Nocardia crassostreae]|uniref:DNA/RNA helicase domain-containing protein n=1 Tax=Nocardia crassostreae TaxID=53428 RepID=UPI000B04B15D|nr:DNA/RNA helicase domain-containing protein [Nocardia crassostreae]
MKAWRNSVYQLALDLDAAGLGQVSMFVEYRIDKPMNPIDVVLAGTHPVTGMFSYAVIELKQWREVDRPRGGRAGDIDFVYHGPYRENKPHPAVQAYKNRIDLQTRHSHFDDRSVNLVAAAYLHNLVAEKYQWIHNRAPRPGVETFTGRTMVELRDFLVANFAPDSGREAAQALLDRQRPVRTFDELVGEIMHGRAGFTLVEHQRTAFDSVVAALQEARAGYPLTKKVFVISGRSGTGKSLIALELLAEARKLGQSALFVSGGTASRDTFRRAAPRGIKSAFVTLAKLAGCDDEAIDLVVCDEAHRLYERPRAGRFGMLPGESSVEVVVNRAKVPVLFVDGDQRLFKHEVWTPDAIRRAAKAMGAEVVPLRLERVVRALGSPTYDTWVSRLLSGAPIPWHPGGESDEPYELYYADSPSQMQEFLESKRGSGVKVRMAAGLCWPWKDRSGTVPEVKIASEDGSEDWEWPWNAGDARTAPGIPARAYWATDPGGFRQLRCVHTAQGLEYHWGGVIMGPDLTWDGDRWVEHRKEIDHGATNIADSDQLNRVLRNAYGVLMTRSLCGTVLYSTYRNTRKLFEELGVPRCPEPSADRKTGTDTQGA